MTTSSRRPGATRVGRGGIGLAAFALLVPPLAGRLFRGVRRLGGELDAEAAGRAPMTMPVSAARDIDDELRADDAPNSDPRDADAMGVTLGRTAGWERVVETIGADERAEAFDLSGERAADDVDRVSLLCAETEALRTVAGRCASVGFPPLELDFESIGSGENAPAAPTQVSAMISKEAKPVRDTFRFGVIWDHSLGRTRKMLDGMKLFPYRK